MKTKNVTVSVLVIISSILGVSAVYSAEPIKAEVTLNSKLNPIQTITVNHTSVDIEYKLEADYKNGLISNQNDHLTVFSTGGFNVNVSSAAHLLNANGEKIAASDVKITATNGTDNTIENNVGAVSLGGDIVLITSSTGGRDLNYNVSYNNQTGTSDKYLNVYDIKNTDNKFTTKVTYTITAI